MTTESPYGKYFASLLWGYCKFLLLSGVRLASGIMYHIVTSAWIARCNTERGQAMSVQSLQALNMQSMLECIWFQSCNAQSCDMHSGVCSEQVFVH